ncbi:beta-fructofuranosidase, insoluble isoenzyme 3-like [Oryza brachyantha]|uniref:beta-fructofuranosidase, insoluble isoenzyme 3-like n=1 Tax=Oryza brachyantha TaxID=4533 RepID=UPI001ADB7AC5|nr:beta-fructofuranosidase, insoluble isoenzyme 3-like [Oryza brachyantha]
MASAARTLPLFFVFAVLALLPVTEASHRSFADLQSLETVDAKHVDDKLRTGFHFQPPKHWINDPNGVMYYKGVYHLFYQYNPKAAVWGNIVWAHAVSTDLVNWVMLDPAIYPTGPFDENGCWSGSATVLPDGTPVIMYTGIDADGRQVQNVAYPKDLADPYLREWVKPDYNPVIAPDAGVNATAFRDPTTAWQGPDGVWRLVIGTKDNHRGFAALYRSRDFRHWAPARRALHSGDTGMWECPDFYPVASSTGGTKHVLKVSLDLTRFEYYTFGEYDHASDTYVPDAALADGNDGLRYDYGNFYASKTFLDPAKHRRVLWGWANESDSTAADVLKGWAGVQAIPRKIWLAPDGKQLLQWPVAEIESLRGNHVNITDALVSGGGSYFEVNGLATPAQADVEASFQVMDVDKAEPFDPAWRGADAQTVCAARGADTKGGVGPFGLWVLASDELKERTAVFFSVFKRGTDDGGNKHVVLMCTDPSRSSYAEHLYKPTFAGFVDVDIAETGKIPLRTLIDHSVVESFGGHGKTAILSRVYPTKAVGDKARLFVFNNGESDVKVASLNAYDMGSAKIRTETLQI